MSQHEHLKFLLLSYLQNCNTQENHDMVLSAEDEVLNLHSNYATTVSAQLLYDAQ